MLEYGFAYGERGTALQGKRMLSAITTGGPAESYAPDGVNRFTIRQLLAPIEQTARFCGMEYLPPFVIHGTHRLASREIEARAETYRSVLLGLRDGTLDLEAARFPPTLHADVEVMPDSVAKHD